MSQFREDLILEMGRIYLDRQKKCTGVSEPDTNLYRFMDTFQSMLKVINSPEKNQHAYTLKYYV